jgi:hypothetical protein
MESKIVSDKFQTPKKSICLNKLIPLKNNLIFLRHDLMGVSKQDICGMSIDMFIYFFSFMLVYIDPCYYSSPPIGACVHQSTQTMVLESTYVCVPPN